VSSHLGWMSVGVYNSAMKNTRRLSLLAFLLPLLATASPVFCQAGPKAKAFIDLLSTPQNDAVRRPLNDPERFDWTFFPGVRDGVRIGDLDQHQRKAFRAFLKSVLSPQGFRRIEMLRKVEAVSDRGGGVRTGFDEFWIRFYGDPGSRAWAWRLEGHHLVVNAVIVDGTVVSLTPLFFGASPVKGGADAPKVARGVEPLRAEDEAAIALQASLSESQRTAAGLGTLPNDIFSGMDRTARIPAEAGVALADLDDPQRALLQSIVDGYLGTWPEEANAHLAAKFKNADPSSVRFATAGPALRGAPHYWRITSPVLILEYSNGRNGANHAHAVLRTVHGEFPEP
jgi:hypothetical protein